MTTTAAWTVLSACKTVVCFVITLISVTVFILLYPGIKTLRRLWLDLLKYLHPKYTFSESNTIRSAVESPRNPGIIHFILTVAGETDVEVVRTKFRDNLLDRRNADNKLIYPKFQALLKKCIGYYVWENQSEFDVSNNILLHTSTYRGRPVTEFNIQLVLSDVVSKYLPSNLPPWQIVLVPVQGCTTILFRIHHLLLTDQPNLKISDILLIDKLFRVEQSRPENAESIANYDRSPFNHVLPQHTNFSMVAGRISTRVANYWNEMRYALFVSSNNGHGPESICQLMRCYCITVIAIFQKFIHNAAGVENKFYFTYLWQLFRKEFQRNHLSLRAIKTCLWNSVVALNPVAMSIDLLTVQGTVFKWLFLQLPIAYLTEMKEFFVWLRNGCCDQYPDSVLGYFLINFPSFYKAAAEVCQYLYVIITGPRSLYDLASAYPCDYNVLQETSSCGRKVIAWSEKIPLSKVERLQLDEGRMRRTTTSSMSSGAFLNSSDLILTWLAASIKDCLDSLALTDATDTVPDAIQVTARCVYQECLLGNMNRADGGVGGILCLNLPLGTGNYRHLLMMRRRLQEARQDNAMLYSLTGNERRQGNVAEIISQHWIKLMTNYLSRKYSVTITDIVTKCGSFAAEQDVGVRTLWGAEVMEFDYLRPPVANTKLSITLQRYRNYVRIAVLADAELSPVHQRIINAWPEFINRFTSK